MLGGFTIMTEVQIIDKDSETVLVTVIVENLHDLWSLLGYSERLALKFFPMEEMEFE